MRRWNRLPVRGLVAAGRLWAAKSAAGELPDRPFHHGEMKNPPATDRALSERKP